MKVICTGTVCGNAKCPHAVPHKPIEHGDGDCREIFYCEDYGGYVCCQETVAKGAGAKQHMELAPA
jgi:hypothetical protein